MDIYKIKDTLSTKRFRDIFCGVLVVLFITAEMFVSAANDWDGRLDIINLIGITSKVLFVIIVLRNIPCKSFAVKVYGAFLVWLIVTRPFCRDVTFEASYNVVIWQIVLLSILLFSCSMNERQKRNLFAAVSVIYCAFYFVVSLGCIYTAITHNDVRLPIFIDIKLMSDYNTYINVTSRNRNNTAIWISIAFALGLCLRSLWHRKKIARCAISIACVVYFAVVGVIHSKTSMLATAVAFAMMTALIAMSFLKTKNKRRYIVIAIVIVLLIAPASYKMFSVTDGFFNELSAYSQPNNTHNEQTVSILHEMDVGKLAEMDAADEMESGNEDAIKLQDKRAKESILSLSGRIPIWKAVFWTLMYEPQRLAIGSTVENYMLSINMKLPNWGINNSMYSVHNVFMETLMLTGFVGTVIMLCFVIILVFRMVIVFFSSEATIFEKTLTIPLSLMLLDNMCESFLIRNVDVTNYIFFLVAGIFLSYSYELFPEKKHWGRRKGKEQSVNDAYSTAVDETTAEQTLPEQVTL